ncbi:hypothetical protein SY88_15755 [Clostridiales bacterium PH28_bin88]|nr:hypothetical protein SY88_15755 [Clostridiales bacterium PH28_bin88]
MTRIAQALNRVRLDDLEAAVRRELAGFNLAGRVRQGDRVCIGVGSRGIRDIHRIVKHLVEELKQCGVIPFVIPAMGSHGGATAAGQLRVLQSYGVTEEYIGCPVVSSLEVVQVGRTAEGIPVYLDRHAAAADHIVVVNRVKPHTLFFGSVQSGLLKMLVIGMGKHQGAIALHQATIEHGTDSQLLDSAARVVLATGKVLLGLAILENGYDETARVEVVAPEEMPEREALLLDEAVRMLPRLPVDRLDLLIVDEIGKEISGSGMDPNVVGRKWDDPMGLPRILRIFVRGLSPHTHGNATGIGRADFTTTRLVESMDRRSTYANTLTAARPEGARIPIYFDSDREVIEAALSTLGGKEPETVRAAWIKNTLQLSEMLVSPVVLEDLRGRPDISTLDGSFPLDFDGDGNLVRVPFSFESETSQKEGRGES